MKKSDDYIVEDLLNDSRKALDELSSLENLLSENNASLDDEISTQSRDRFLYEDEEAQVYRIDGYVELRISDNRMFLTGDFYPPSEGLNPIALEGVYGKLTEKGVVYGVDEQRIQEAIFKCNTGSEPVLGILMAEGKEPVNEIPEHLIIEDRLISKKVDFDNDKQIDYKEASPFVLVKEGETLAKIVAHKNGSEGTNIFGEVIDFKVEKINTYIPGQNVKVYDDHVASECDGRFELNKNDFFVNEVLQIKTDVNYSTGHINFPGDVLIGGHIQDGFKIESGGSIFAMKTLDASEIICGSDLNVKQGIIGRKKATVKVGGIIRAKFTENCYIEADGDIFLEIGTMNSAVHTSGKLELGKKGVIIGGTIYAQNGVSAVQIGSRMGPRTEIYCGIDYHISNKLVWIRDNSIKLATRLNQVEQEIIKQNSKAAELLEIKSKLKDSMHKLNELASSLVFKLDRNEDAQVIVSGTVYPGVYIEICHISYVVDREMTNVRFQLDKPKGVIIIS